MERIYADRRALLADLLRPGTRCVVGSFLADHGHVTCDGWAVDGHEVKSRARGGSIIDPDNVIPVCRSCHTWITEHPALAASYRMAAASHEADEVVASWVRAWKAAP